MAREPFVPRVDEAAPTEVTPPAYVPASRHELRDILGIALLGGQVLISSGSETWRVEEILHRLGAGLGAEVMEIYSRPTGIILSAVAGNEHRTRIPWVKTLGVDMGRVAAVLGLSHRIKRGELSLEEARAEMERIVTIVSCAAFAGLAGGSWLAMALGLYAGATTVLVREQLDRFFGRPVLVTMALSAFAGASAASLGLRLFPVPAPEPVMIAAIITLVPGVPMVLSIADLINANYVSGLARAAQAALYLAAISVRKVASLALLGGQAFA